MPTDPGDVACETLSWSQDGRYLAVPRLTLAPALSVIRADTGQVLKTLEAAAWPAWSPDGTRLAFIVTKPTVSLQILDTSFGPPRQIVELGQTFQPPAWSRDGKSVLAVARRTAEPGGRLPTRQVDLLAARLDARTVDTLLVLAADLGGKDKATRSVSFAVDGDGNDLFYTDALQGQPSVIVWARPRTKETVDRFHPIAFGISAGSLALSPAGLQLAARLGPHAGGATVGVWDVASRQWNSIVADETVRQEWVSMLVAAARKVLQASLPRAAVGGVPVERPTLLPVPGEMPEKAETTALLRRIGRTGRPLCDAPSGSPSADVSKAEARLFFDVLREDFRSALVSLDALDGAAGSADDRLRLLCVRAQVLLGAGDVERARDVVDYLRAADSLSVSRWEETPAGVTTTAGPSATRGWAGYLSLRLDDVARGRPRKAGAPGGPSDRTDRVTPFPAPPALNGPFGPGPGEGFPPPGRLRAPFQPMPGAGDPAANIPFRRPRRPPTTPQRPLILR